DGDRVGHHVTGVHTGGRVGGLVQHQVWHRVLSGAPRVVVGAVEQVRQDVVALVGELPHQHLVAHGGRLTRRHGAGDGDLLAVDGSLQALVGGQGTVHEVGVFEHPG